MRCRAPASIAATSIAHSDAAVSSASASGSVADKAKKESGMKRKTEWFDPRRHIRKGICGYEHCVKPIDKACIEDDESISCSEHHLTWQTGYKYEPEELSQTKYGQNMDYQNSINNSNEVLHRQAPKGFPPAKITTFMDNYGEADRMYGAWTQSVPLK